MAQFLNLVGLTKYDEKIKAYIMSKVSGDLESYYTKTEVDNKIAFVAHLKLSVVDALPTADIRTDTIYLVKKAAADTQNAYDEYIYANGAWEKIGDTKVDLTDYAKTADVAATYAKISDLEVVDANATTALTKVTKLESGDTAAAKATGDANGNTIHETYATKTEVNTAQTNAQTYADGKIATAKQEAIDAASDELDAYKTTNNAAVASKVDQTEYDEFSTQVNTALSEKATSADLQTLEEKVEGLVTAGGEPNKLESVKVNGTALPITDKAVNIDLTSYAQKTELHSHSNKDVLDATTASYTTAEKTKLADVEAGAQVNVMEYVLVGGIQLQPDEHKLVSIEKSHLVSAIGMASADSEGLMSFDDYNKLNGIAAKATADSAIPTSDIEALFA